jgi:predicted Zn-dependent protease
MIGTRLEDGIERPFSSAQELRTAGLVNEAMILVQNNRFFDAERSLRQAHFLQPGSDQLTFNLAVVLGQVGQPEEASQLLEALNRRKPGQPAYMVALADARIMLGDASRARELLKRVFRLFKDAQNYPRAARIARSISNVSFELGEEQEALCYSHEAYTLESSAEQLGWHARILIALNQFPAALRVLQESINANRGLASSASVQHALALVRFAEGDRDGALAAEEAALDFINQSPLLGAEVNAAWWVMKRQAVTDSEDEEISERLESMRIEIVDFVEKPSISITTWPASMRAALELEIERAGALGAES